MSYNQYKIGQPGPLEKKIKEIIFRSDYCMVYMDEDDTIQWSTYTDGLLDLNFGEIQNDVSYWEALSNKLFDEKDSYEYKCLLAEAYARILDGKNLESAKSIIDNTKNRIEKQGKEVLKQNYIISSLIFTVLIMISLLLIVLNKSNLAESITEDKYQIIITTLFGGIGAFIFTTLRLKTYEPEIVISKCVHRIDGILRIFYGIISGLVIGICIKSDLLLGFIQNMEKTTYVFAFLGIAAGASEILIPNLIKQIEEK